MSDVSKELRETFSFDDIFTFYVSTRVGNGERVATELIQENIDSTWEALYKSLEETYGDILLTKAISILKEIALAAVNGATSVPVEDIKEKGAE